MESHKTVHCADSTEQNPKAEWPHQETCARDHIGVVDGEPGFVFVEVRVRHVEHVEAEDCYNPPGKHGFRDVTVESNNTFKLQKPL